MSEELAALKRCIGQESAPTRYVVDAGSVKYFADSIMDPDPLYRDEEYARGTKHGGIVAPPTFFGGAIGLQGIPAGDPRTMFGQVLPLPAAWLTMATGDEFDFVAPVRPGMTLACRERLVDAYEKQGRSGRLLFYTFEKTFRNAEGDLLLRRKIFCAARQHRPVLASARGAVARRGAVKSPGSMRECTVGPVTVRYLAMFATATAEFVDIHYDADYARSVGLPGPIVQGLYKTAIIGQMLKNYTGDGTAIKRLSVQHRVMDVAGSVLTAGGRVLSAQQSGTTWDTECEVWVRNQDGAVTTVGTARVESSDPPNDMR
ncbi:MAG: MaoC family dehydratase N-terminal domain-containing protein [Chloroflexi bacterium]|nr:MaoC family dehydratase N-terminal domain-containing protein [Chloroflexota bacterium]